MNEEALSAQLSNLGELLRGISQQSGMAAKACDMLAAKPVSAIERAAFLRDAREEIGAMTGRDKILD